MAEVAPPVALANGVASNGVNNGSPKKEEDSVVNGAFINNNDGAAALTNGTGADASDDDDIPWAERIKAEEAARKSKTPELEKSATAEPTPAEKPAESANEASFVKKKKDKHSSADSSKKDKHSSSDLSKKDKHSSDTSKKDKSSEDVKKEKKRTPEPEKRKSDRHKDKEDSSKKEKVLKEHKKSKREYIESDEDEAPPKRKSKTAKGADESGDSDWEKPKNKKSKTSTKVEKTVEKHKSKKGTETEVKVQKRKVIEIDSQPTSSSQSPTKRKKKVEEEEEVWKWWEEQKREDGTKWSTLEHKGPLFAPEYEPVPEDVHFKYDGKVMHLSKETEEVASFYARMLDHDYTSKEVFNNNFFKDWRKIMTPAEREQIKELKKCDFTEMAAYFKAEAEKRRNMSKEEKQKIKEQREAEAKIYGFAIIDGHKQKIGNFRIEPPGLFRGRGEHPKMGKLKKRIQPEDVIINCAKGSAIPVPPEGHQWKEVRHDNTVTWLSSWTENVLGNNKYIMLNPSSKIKGEKDYEKFETARKLNKLVDKIRKQYTEDFKSREMRVRQRAVALYFIDKLALRAGNEKDTDEAADTVGCCSLRCEHVKLHDELEGDKYVVEFDFPGKDSIRYQNKVPVEKQVFKNLKLFKENKSGSDDLFDRLDTSSLNAHLRSLMPNLTAKVFRTYNASHTLQEQLNKETKENYNVHEKILAYNRANRAVAILCNHQRAVPKTHEKSMENLEAKIKEKKKELKEVKRELEKARGKEKEKLEKKKDRIKEQLRRLKIQRTDKDENKTIALGTSKLNYLDPRISVAWCKKFNVPIEKVYNKTQREKFRWAIDMIMNSDEDYEF